MKWYNLEPLGKPYGKIVDKKLIFQWQNLVRVGEQEFFINDKLISIFAQKKQIVLIFSHYIYLFDGNFSLLEKLDNLSLPMDKRILATYESRGELFLETDKGIFLVDSSWQNFVKVTVSSHLSKILLEPLDGGNLLKARESLSHENLSIYRVINDLHSGAFFGKFGYFLNRFTALSLIYLIISGLLLYQRNKNVKK